MNFRIYSIIINLLLCTSCTHLEVIEQAKPNVAVLSFFTNDSIVEVDIVPVNFAFKNKAVGIVVDDLILTNISTQEVFNLNQSDSSFLFSTPHGSFRKGDKLEINGILNDGTHFHALDSIPKDFVDFKIINLGVFIDEDGAGSSAIIENTGLISIDAENLQSGHYYELLVYSSYNYEEYSRPLSSVQTSSNTSFIVAEDYYPDKSMLNSYKPRTLLFACPDVSSDLKIDFSYLGGIMVSQANGTLVSEHHLLVELRNISEAYYKYKTSLYKQKSSIEGDVIYGAGATVVIPSNIKNATGVFAGYTVSRRDTFVRTYLHEKK